MARGVKRLLKILLVLILLGAIAYVSIVLMVCWKETHVAAPGEDYEAMLVLGAQVKPDGTPSLQLQWRPGKGGGLPFLTKPSKQASSVSCIFPNCA